MENDDIINAIEELRAELLREPYRAPPLPVRRVIRPPASWMQLAADIAGHYDKRIAEIHGAAMAIGEPPLVQQLQQDVEDVSVRLFDFVEAGARYKAGGERPP